MSEGLRQLMAIAFPASDSVADPTGDVKGDLDEAPPEPGSDSVADPTGGVKPITGHVWRPPPIGGGAKGGPEWAARPCEFAGCGRSRDEHERSIGRKGGRWPESARSGDVSGGPPDAA